MGNPLVELQRLGQSPWHDNIHRALLTSGALKRMVAAGDVTGLTSNPTIFELAIARSTDYDDMLARLARRGMSAEAIVDTLAVTDIRDAADVFAPVFKRTAGGDGMVSIEVAPKYAHDTETTIKEAHRLWKAVNRPNLMVKIPATPAGVPAIEQCIADGLNINVTLIFSLQRYREVMEAYLAGLARRVGKGKRIDGVNSVASFFVSRVDTTVDKQLDEMLRVAGPDQAAQLRPLQGQAAIANAKLAYAEFRRTFDSDRFRELERRGGRKQRPLWASTSTKNPAYPDVYYVEALVGPDTVDTLPPATITAYKDHGKPVSRLDQRLDEAVAVLQRLEDAGIGMDEVTRQLEVEGVASFAKSFDSLVAVVAARREAVLFAATTAARLGAGARTVRTALGALDAARVGERLWKKDPTLWKPDDAAAQALIAAAPRLARRRRVDARQDRRAHDVRGRGAPRRLHTCRALRHGRLVTRPRSAAPHLRRRARLPRPGGARLDRSGGGAGSGGEPGAHALRHLLQIGRHHRGNRVSALLLGSRPRDARRAQRRALRRHHRRRNVAGSARAPAPVPPRVPQSTRDRRPLLGAFVFRPGTGGSAGGRSRRSCWHAASACGVLRAPSSRRRRIPGSFSAPCSARSPSAGATS